jgi:hypothetical protein
MSVLSQIENHVVAQYRICRDEIAVFRNYARDVSAIPDDVVAKVLTHIYEMHVNNHPDRSLAAFSLYDY